MNMSKFIKLSFTAFLLVVWTAGEARAQFLQTWVDIGEMQSRYSEVGAHSEGSTANRSVEWPAILRQSGHYRAKAYWIGLRNWTDEFGRTWNITMLGLDLALMVLFISLLLKPGWLPNGKIQKYLSMEPLRSTKSLLWMK